MSHECDLPGWRVSYGGFVGRCSLQANSDRDSFGDACDACRDVTNDETQENSNPLSETREGTDPLGDPLLGSEFLGQDEVVAVPTARQFRPEEVLASAYDSQTGTLLILDRAKAADVDRRPHHRSRSHGRDHEREFVRLVRYDVRAETSSLVAQWPSTGAFERFGMTTANDGAFLVVLSPKRSRSWTALRFSITAQGRLKWEAVQHGRGEVLDEPVRTTYATHLPVRERGIASLVTLELRPFRRHEGAPDRW